MVQLTNIEAASNLLDHVLTGRLVQNAWHTVRDGQEVACMLGALHAGIDRAESCPSNVMPDWLASLIPSMFDGLPSSTIYEVGAELADRMARWNVLTPDQWDTVRLRLNTLGVRRDYGFETDPIPAGVKIIESAFYAGEELTQSVLSALTEAELDYYDALGDAADYDEYPSIENLNARTFFDSLIQILDELLPEPVEQDFTFELMKPVTVTIREKSPVKAFYLAKQSLKEPAKPTLPEAVQKVLHAAAKLAAGEIMPWSEDVDEAIKVTRERNPDFVSGSSTVQALPALKEYWAV